MYKNSLICVVVFMMQCILGYSQGDSVRVTFDAGKFHSKIEYNKPTKIIVPINYTLEDGKSTTTVYGVTLEISGNGKTYKALTTKKLTTYELTFNELNFYANTDYTFKFTLQVQPSSAFIAELREVAKNLLKDEGIITNRDLDVIRNYIHERLEQNNYSFSKSDYEGYRATLNSDIISFNNSEKHVRKLKNDLIENYQQIKEISKILEDNGIDSKELNEIVEKLATNLNLENLMKLDDDLLSNIPQLVAHEVDQDKFQNELVDLFGEMDIQGLKQTYKGVLDNDNYKSDFSDLIVNYFSTYITFEITPKDTITTDPPESKSGLRAGIGVIYFGRDDYGEDTKVEIGPYLNLQYRYYLFPIDHALKNPYNGKFHWRISANIGTLIGVSKYFGEDLQKSQLTILPTVSIGIDIISGFTLDVGMVGFSFPRIVGVPESNNQFHIRPTIGISFDYKVLQKLTKTK